MMASTGKRIVAIGDGEEMAVTSDFLMEAMKALSWTFEQGNRTPYAVMLSGDILAEWYDMRTAEREAANGRKEK